MQADLGDERRRHEARVVGDEACVLHAGRLCGQRGLSIEKTAQVTRSMKAMRSHLGHRRGAPESVKALGCSGKFRRAHI
ncbi:MAG TPA: hypothetical protein PK264_16215, partial [Hyphomicrobiaceae bacterium]|nr:hypothetical protein [Hyphomicrobiaceae bacterium]